MRTLVDIPDKQLKELTRLSKAHKTSRAAIIRDAINSYLNKGRFGPGDPAFGAWKGIPVDGLEYQRKLREEEG